MTVVNIEGVGKVKLDDSFATLPPDEQNKIIEEIIQQTGGPKPPEAQEYVQDTTSKAGEYAGEVGKFAMGMGHQFTGGFNERMGRLAGGMADVDPIERGLGMAGEAFGFEPPRTPVRMASDWLRSPTMTGPEPQGAAQRIVRRGGEVLAETVPTAGGLFGLARAGVGAGLQAAAPVSQKVAGSVLDLIRANPLASAAIERAGAIGAGLGGGTARELAPDNPTAEFVGELAGGVAAPLATAYSSPALLARGTRAGVRALTDRFTEEGQARRAADFIGTRLRDELSSDTAREGMERAARVREEIPGFEPSLAQQTELPSLTSTQQQLERTASGPALDQAISRHAANREAVERYRQQAAPPGEGSAEDALRPLVADREAAGRQLRTLEQERARLDQLRKDAAEFVREQRSLTTQSSTAASIQRAEEAANIDTAMRALSDQEATALSALDNKFIAEKMDLAQGVRPQFVVDRKLLGGRIRGELQAARQARSEEMSQLARDLGINDADMAVPFQAFQQRVTQWRDGLLPSQREHLPDALKDIDELAKRVAAGRPFTFQDVKALREGLTIDMLEATRSTAPGFRRRIAASRQLLGMVDQHLLGFDEASESARAAASYARSPDFDTLLESAKRGVRPAATEENRLSSFIVARGGLRDGWSELRGTDVRRPGLLNSRGMTMEQAAEAARNAGFFDDVPASEIRSDAFVRRFQQALEDDVMGRQRTYTGRDQATLDQSDEAAGVAEDLARRLDEVLPGWEAMDAAAVRSRLASAGEPIDPAFAANYATFRKRYFEDFIKPFEQGTVLDAKKTDGSGFYRTLDEEVATEFLSSQEAARQFQAVLGTNRQALGDLTAVALDGLADAAIRDGMINPRGLDTWITRHRGALQELPEIKAVVDRLKADTDAAVNQSRAAEDMLRQRVAAERSRLVAERDATTRGRIEDRRTAQERDLDIAEQFRAQDDELRAAQQKLDEALTPLRERMGLLTERQMAREDQTLARRIAAIEGGQKQEEDVIREALQSPRLMLNLTSRLGGEPQAMAALRRKVWDDLGQLDGQRLAEFMDANEKSLRLVFSDRHRENLRTMADALRMLDAVPPPLRGQAISPDMIEDLRRSTGFNPMQASSRLVNIKSGRLSARVAGFDFLMRTLNARRTGVAEQMMREALYNPQVAESLMARMPVDAAGRPNRAITAWLATRGILHFAEDE
jgi:hypothetical protein